MNRTKKAFSLAFVVLLFVAGPLGCLDITSNVDICIKEGARFPQTEEEMKEVRCQPLPDSVSVGI